MSDDMIVHITDSDEILENIRIADERLDSDARLSAVC
jgi:hypothetical protein